MSDKSDTPRTDAAEAWLITCRGPGRSLTYATVDKNDTLHWPLDQWATVETVSLVRESELAEAMAECERLRNENSLMAAHQGIDNYQRVIGRAEKAEAELVTCRNKLKASGLYKLREGLAECRAERERADRLIAFLADDALAITYQSLAQYRQAAIDAARRK